MKSGYTKGGYKLNWNGKPILTLQKGDLLLSEYKGVSFKKEGDWYYFACKRGNQFLYIS